MARRSDSGHRAASDAAAGRNPFDLLVTNARIVNVHTGEIVEGHIGIAGGRFARVIPSEETEAEGPLRIPATLVIDAGGQYAVPGLVDSHLHLESSMLLPGAFAQAVVPRGVLTVTPDPHEIVNVMGLDGMRLLLDESRGLPMDLFFQVPSCVPATSLETAGAAVGPEEVREALGWEGVVALGEVMDYPAVISGDDRMAGILGAALDAGAVVEGHAPGLFGADLAAFVAAGVTSDHTLMTPGLALERLRSGVVVQLQEKSLSPEVLAVAGRAAQALNLCLVTDDVPPDDLLARGHLDVLIREAVRKGMDPIQAVRAATLAPARRMRLYDRGAIAPGMVAHMVLVSDLAEFHAAAVFSRGTLVARDGTLTPEAAQALRSAGEAALAQARGRNTVRLSPPGKDRFGVGAPRGAARARVRVIEMNRQTTHTRSGEALLRVDGSLLAWEESDLCLAAVFERHGRGGAPGAGNVGYGLVRGALVQGAVATTWAHDSHNLLVIGRSADDMAAAARWVVEQGGGMAAVVEGRLLAGVPLPVAGIISDQPVSVVGALVARFRSALAELGFTHRSPIMTLGVLTLAVSPEIKLTDRGLVDVGRGRIVDLFIE